LATRRAAEEKATPRWQTVIVVVIYGLIVLLISMLICELIGGQGIEWLAVLGTPNSTSKPNKRYLKCGNLALVAGVRSKGMC
jgi:hypothetical protein